MLNFCSFSYSGKTQGLVLSFFSVVMDDATIIDSASHTVPGVQASQNKHCRCHCLCHLFFGLSVIMDFFWEDSSLGCTSSFTLAWSDPSPRLVRHVDVARSRFWHIAFVVRVQLFFPLRSFRQCNQLGRRLQLLRVLNCCCKNLW